jgi:hypothetical protein
LVIVDDIKTAAGLLEAGIYVDGRRHCVFFKSQLPLSDNTAEALLLLALPAAMCCGQTLKINSPVSAQLIRQLPAIQDIYQEWEPKLQKVEVIAAVRERSISQSLPSSGREAISFTAGVDSFYSALKSDHAALMFVHGLDIPLDNLGLRQRVSEKLGWVASELNRPLLEMETNLRAFSDRYLKWQLAYGGALAACALLLSRQLDTFCIAAGQSQKPFHADGAHPLLNALFSTEDVTVKTVGCETSRIDKVKAIANHPVVQGALRVCWENRGDAYNCGVCEKCLRTMASLEIFSAYDSNTSFDMPLDYGRLSRAVSMHQSTQMFIEENLLAARANNCNADLISSLEKSLNPRRVWLFRLLHNKIPRIIYDRCYRLLHGSTPGRSGMLNKPKKIDPDIRHLRSRYDVATPRPGLLEWLSIPVTWMGRWLDVLLLEKRKWEKLPWKHRFRSWRHGFSSFSYRLYELDKNTPQDYVPDVAHMRFGYGLNGRYTDAIFSKVVFSRILTSLGVPQPAVLGVLLRGRFYPEQGDSSETLIGLRCLLENGQKLVLRPSFGGGGTGIFFLQQIDGGILVNGLPADKLTFESLIRPLHDYLVTAFVIQAEYAGEIAPESTNTLRILTLWDVEKDKPFIAASCHRFGRSGSGPLDNFHAGAGGLSVPIDPNTGVLGLAVIREAGEIKRLSHHPDTGKAIDGVSVPGWNKTIDELLSMAARLPYAPCIGWDLVQQERAWVCLEGNPFPGYHVWQVHAPILKCARARRFYQEFGMLK